MGNGQEKSIGGRVTDTPIRKLGFLIFPGFPMACLTSMIEPLRAANEILGRRAFTWSLIGESKARVTSSAEVGFDPDFGLGDARDLDHLFLLSSPQSQFANPKNANVILHQLAKAGTRIGGISGGVFPLARAGLMIGRTASVHWCYRTAFEAEFPEIETVDDVIYVDQGRTTVSGAAAGFDAMLSLIEQDLGADVMTEVACWFQHPLVRGAGVQQRVPLSKSSSTDDMLPKSMLKAVQLFSENFEEPIGVADVAEIIGMSPRNLVRRFKKATGQNPINFYRTRRMNAARQLVQYSGDNMLEIALAVGYSSSAAMVKYYKAEFGITPQEDREKINMFRVTKNAPVPST